MIAKMILLGLFTLSLGIEISRHGKKRSRRNGWHSLINYVILLALLYWSGFFDSFN